MLRSRKAFGLRAGVFKLQHVRRVLGQAGIQQVILRAPIPKISRAKINNAVRTRQGVILLVDEVRHDQQGLACPPRHDQQIILSCLASEPIHPTVSLVGYALYLFPQVLFFIGKRIRLPLLFCQRPSSNFHTHSQSLGELHSSHPHASGVHSRRGSAPNA